MKSNHSVQYSLLLVIFAHAAALAAILFAPQEPAPPKIEPPTIQGVLISVEPEKKVEPIPPPPPPPEKPQPKPKTPLPKAPPSERAVQQDADPQPAPVTEQKKPADPAPAAVTPPSASASELNNPRPPYPSASNKLREEGIVLLEVLVKADGSVGELRLKKSSGYKRLDDSALRTVKNWHFSPATRGGEAMDFWYELPIEFSLNQ